MISFNRQQILVLLEVALQVQLTVAARTEVIAYPLRHAVALAVFFQLIRAVLTAAVALWVHTVVLAVDVATIVTHVSLVYVSTIYISSIY